MLVFNYAPMKSLNIHSDVFLTVYFGDSHRDSFISGGFAMVFVDLKLCGIANLDAGKLC